MILIWIGLGILSTVGLVVIAVTVISALKKDDKPTFPKPETWDKRFE